MGSRVATLGTDNALREITLLMAVGRFHNLSETGRQLRPRESSHAPLTSICEIRSAAVIPNSQQFGLLACSAHESV